MSTTSENNKRIAKNTLLLYFRMLFMMIVSLYTSRVVLSTLGVEDYGLYNVVGGIVVVLSFLNSAMAGATQRYLNFEMGHGDSVALKRVFSTSLLIHFIVSGVILLMADYLGLWFLNNHMVIAEDRIMAANWVYQFSIASFILTVLSVPYNATIVAHEKMSAFAYISIIEVVLKLLIVYLIQVLLFDKLIMYGFLIMLISVTIRIIYGTYCKRKFIEATFSKQNIDKSLLKNMLSFSSWTIFGNLGYILHTQGIAIVINMFFGAAVNAAQGISNQVNSAVSGFVSNFQMALNPQIVKNYAAGNLEDMHKLMYRGCRFSFFLISIFAIPLIIEAPAILNFWLEEVPEYTIIFVRLILLISVCNSYSSIMATAQGATGKIKIYQITLTTIGALHVPFTILLFYLDYEPYYCSWVYLAIIVILQIIRISFVSRSTQMPIKGFIRMVLVPCFIVLIISSLIPCILHQIISTNFGMTTVNIIVSFIWTFITIMFVGLEKSERLMILERINKKNKKY